MGLCLGASDNADPEQLAQNKRVESQLKAELKARRLERSILVLGAGGCGKSTFLSQVKRFHGRSAGEEFPAEHTAAVLRGNLLDNAAALVAKFTPTDGKPAAPAGFSAPPSDAAATLAGLNKLLSGATPPDAAAFCEQFGQLLAHRYWRKRLEPRLELLKLSDAARFLFDNHVRIMDANFQPSLDDVMWMRQRTSGVVDYFFSYKEMKLKIVDVGGQRAERSKWIHCFADVNVLVFFASLGEYDLTLEEDPATNRMHESLTLWEEIVNSRWFLNKPVTLVLNKRDVFEKKFPLSPLSKTFVDFPKDGDVEQGMQFIAEKFLACLPSREKCAHFFTCATQGDSIRPIIESIMQAMLTASLESSGLL